MTQRLPVTVIGGYLGAGKTTLLNHLLHHANGKRLAVMVNDFGDLPIDAQLIEGQEGDVISLAGGCVCCSFGDDLPGAIQRLAASSPAPDHVLIEASGVAIPGGILSALSLLREVRTDAVIVMADAVNLRKQARDTYMGDTVLRQLRDAGIIILSKGDLVDADTCEDLRTWIADKAPQARLIEAVQGAVDPQIIMSSALPPPGAAAPHSETTGLVARTLTPRTMDPETLARTLAAPKTGLVRAKGFARTPDGAMKIIQVVGTLWDITDAPAGATPGIVCLGFAPEISTETLAVLGA